MLYIRLPELIHPVTEDLLPFPRISTLPNPSVPANYHFALCFCEFFEFVNTFLNNQWVEQEIMNKIRTYFRRNENRVQ